MDGNGVSEYSYFDISRVLGLLVPRSQDAVPKGEYELPKAFMRLSVMRG